MRGAAECYARSSHRAPLPQNDVAEEESHPLFLDSLAHFRGVLSDGSYSCACPLPLLRLPLIPPHRDSPHTLPAAGAPLRVEHCLYASQPDAAGGATRLRLVYSIIGEAGESATAGSAPTWRLLSLEVFNERRPAAQPGSDPAEATAAGVEGWAVGPRPRPKALFGGFWEASAGAALNILPSDTSGGVDPPPPSRILPVPCWAMEPRPQWSVGPRSSSGLPGCFLVLPLGMWAYVEQATPEMLIVESGRLLGDGSQRQVVACSYTKGQLEAVTLGSDGQLALADAAGKGYLQSDDPEESAFFAELLRELELDSDAVRVPTADATPYSEMGGETREYVEEEDEEWLAARAGRRATREEEAGREAAEGEEEDE